MWAHTYKCKQEKCIILVLNEQAITYNIKLQFYIITLYHLIFLCWLNICSWICFNFRLVINYTQQIFTIFSTFSFHFRKHAYIFKRMAYNFIKACYCRQFYAKLNSAMHLQRLTKKGSSYLTVGTMNGSWYFKRDLNSAS